MNGIKIFILGLFLSLIIATGSGCQPDDTPPEAPKHHGPFYLGEARDYVFFKPGTWWVYENSKTKERDSIVVISMGVDTITYRSVQTTTTVTTERLWWKAQSQMDDYIYHFYLRHTPSPTVWDAQKYTQYQWQFSLSKYKSGDYVGLKTIFSYPFDLLPTRNSDLIRLEVPDTMRLDTNLYEGIFAVENKKTLFFDTRDKAITRHYWARGAGLIKREGINFFTSDTTSWDLVNLHILK